MLELILSCQQGDPVSNVAFACRLAIACVHLFLLYERFGLVPAIRSSSIYCKHLPNSSYMRYFEERTQLSRGKQSVIVSLRCVTIACWTWAAVTVFATVEVILFICRDWRST